jgi:FkbM family methyltransferase
MTTKKTSFLNRLRLAFRNRFAETLLISLTRGKQWDHWLAKIPANYYQYKKGSLRRVNRDGSEFILDLSEYMQWLIYFGIRTEPRETLYAMIKPGMQVIDVGANIGETTLRFAKLIGKEGRVISFEPFPATFSKLQANISLNKDRTNITAVNKALGDHPAVLHMKTAAGNSGENRIDAIGGNTPVDAVRLDDWLQEHPEIKPDFIKIDVEGFEMKVLRGADKTLRTLAPVLFMEVNPEFLSRAGDSADELMRYLSAHGYSLSDAENGSVLHPSEPLSKPHFDLIARKK